MKGRAARLLGHLPGARWLPDRVARIRASVRTKLLTAFLSMVALLVVLGAVGLGALQSADKRATELVQLERRIAAYRQLQHNTREQLHAVASAFLAADERELDTSLRWLQRLNYDFDRAEYVARDDNQLLRDIKAEYGTLIETGTQIIEFIRSTVRRGTRAPSRALGAAREPA